MNKICRTQSDDQSLDSSGKNEIRFERIQKLFLIFENG